MAKIRILLADDHAIVREGTRRVLEEEDDMEVVAEAGDGEEAVKETTRLKPDVVLMDIAMPRMNGIQATQQIKEALPHICILVLTAYDNPEFVSAVIAAGAEGYLLKNVRGKELTNAIRTAHAGDSVLHPTIAKALFNQLMHSQTKPQRGKVDALSAREQEVVRLGAEGMSNKQIAAALSIGPRTVQTHWRNIFDKLGVYSRTEAIVHCLRKGWLTLEEQGSSET